MSYQNNFKTQKLAIGRTGLKKKVTEIILNSNLFTKLNHLHKTYDSASALSGNLPRHQSGISSILFDHLPLMLNGRGTAPGHGTCPGTSQMQAFSFM